MPAQLFPYPGALPQVTSTGGALFTAGEVFRHEELQAMAMDGLLRHVYAGTFVRWDVRPDPVVRALAASAELPPPLRRRLTMGRLTAAWIYGCAPRPPRLDVLADRRSRTGAMQPFSTAVLHEVLLGPADRVDVGTVSVTSPLRTAVDVALYAGTADAVAALRRLAAHPVLGCRLDLVRRALEAGSRVPGKAAALERVAAAADPAD
ncbi:type IV toxin-antitoxin system AbiEi family antitoxin [Arthrobacter zhaoxinii]|uniref:type IV toxin-antitoxin system AbiEi family antitoxin n=1 Tax=Arthrobacter zhaoxinii TaxID=2964616 RepID=UPI0021032A63|nr:type IV toxin-antitoxin system AbiEi family antitoxin [Arthrobacter zhaoxinii]MCQ2000643.1 type IV toxin-antitoxin system AbiEi family antitoxin [Arthrobacter zhaoxinii]